MSSGQLRIVRRLGWALHALAVIVGAVYGYGFGQRVSGVLFGLLTAALAVVFCSILADAALQRLRRGRR
jgi:hypothetical protein